MSCSSKTKKYAHSTITLHQGDSFDWILPVLQPAKMTLWLPFNVEIPGGCKME